MSKHIIDQPRVRDSARLREFLRQEREASLHPAIETLRSRPQMRAEENRRAMEYTRIEREQMG